MSILKMDIFNTDALIQMLEAVQAKGYKIAAAYILEKSIHVIKMTTNVSKSSIVDAEG